MPTKFISTNTVGTGNRVSTAADNFDVVVQSGVLVGSTDAIGILLTGSSHDVAVFGTVYGDDYGIQLGNAATDSRNVLKVADGGSVYGNVGALIQGSARIYNDGEIHGAQHGMKISLEGTGSSTVINRGVISGGSRGILVNGSTDSSFQLVNYGVVEGASAYYGSSQTDKVINRGVMHGDFFLGGGNDLYDGRMGTHEGDHILRGEAGDDRYIAGAGAEIFDGGDGVDTLDFRLSQQGLRVSLVDDQGTGYATGDRYFLFERILGSQGHDVLVGDRGANTLVGHGGDDRIRGGAGADVLEGGFGDDIMNGGAGNDSFVYRSPDPADSYYQQGDTIQSFGTLIGNDDRFQFSASGFEGGLVKSDTPLAADRFVTRTEAFGPLAGDENDRFIFRTTDGTLWFDVDGTGAEAAVLLARVPGAMLTNEDIFIIA